MEFNSLIFIFLFLPLFLTLYFFIASDLKNSFLIIASFVFYAWAKREAVFILLILIFVNYYFSILISDGKVNRRSKKIYIFGIIFNVSVLIFYKYLTFLLGMFGIKFHLEGLPFPTGISFITFLSISYLTDIYRKVVPLKKKISSYMLYISLFPKLITGPITIYSAFEKQLGKRNINLNDISEGVKRFITGLGKKVIIADTLAKTANGIFIIPSESLNFSLSWIGLAAYTLQIYYDFSGYSDMAIGLGKMIGFNIPENFNFPYSSRSIKDFWNRWHITLGIWLKTYIFFPIAYSVMRMTGKSRILHIKIENIAYLTGIILTFFLCGVWHGAAWTFILWGTYYGVLLAIEHIGVRKFAKRNLPEFVRMIITLFFVMIGWVFFRSPDLKYSLNYIGNLFGFGGKFPVPIGSEFFLNREFILISFLAVFGSFPIFKMINGIISKTFRRSLFLYTVLENIFYLSVFIMSIMAITGGTYKPFIYFRF